MTEWYQTDGQDRPKAKDNLAPKHVPKHRSRSVLVRACVMNPGICAVVGFDYTCTQGHRETHETQAQTQTQTQTQLTGLPFSQNPQPDQVQNKFFRREASPRPAWLAPVGAT